MKRNLRLFSVVFFLAMHWIVYGQGKTVAGKVTDDANQPLPGVSIVIEGTSNGTITDVNGQYSLSVPDGKNVLVFSFIGFKTQKIDVAGRTTIELQLDPESLGINEVVVVGYGTMKKSDLTGAVSKVGGESLQQTATVDVVQTLQGKVAGVDVVANSGEPGAGTKIRIRGVGSWGNSNPIYVVDGFPMDNISNIEPSNIQSIEILKDASATAIYGSRGANGVVLVTTKQGKKGKSVIEANAYAGVQYASSRINLTNAWEFATLRKEAFDNSGKSISADELEVLNYVIDNRLEGTDWQEELLNTTSIQNYNVSATGGTENSTYNVGASYFHQEGLVKNSGMQKLFLWANNEYQLFEKVKLGVNVSYSTYEKNNHNRDEYSGALPVALRMDPLTPAWDEYTQNYGTRFLSGDVLLDPAVSVDHAKNQKSGDSKLVGNISLTFDDLFVEGLTFRTMYASDLTFYRVKNFFPQFYLDVDQKRDESELYEQRGNNINWAWNGYFNYNKSLGSVNMNLMVGSEAQQFTGTDMTARGFNVPNNTDLMYLSLAKNRSSKEIGGGAYKNTLLSYFARTNISVKDRYMLTATLRADGSSKFLDDNKWGYFPSFSAGWNIKQENFMSNVYFVDQLKLRAGWGQVGNEGSIGSSNYITTMNSGFVYVVNGTTVDGAVARKLANSDIKWETSEQTNIGVDMAYLQQRMTVSVDYFNRMTRDLLLDRPIPYYVGAQRPSVNAGTMRNSGWDFSVNWNDQTGSGFKYEIGLNLSALQNEVEDLAGGEDFSGNAVNKLGSVTRVSQGDEMGYFYGLQTDGIINDQAELDAYLAKVTSSKASLGDVKFVDVDGNGEINEDDRVKLGSPFPDFTAGLNVSLGFKGFDFKAFVYGSFGNEIVCAHKYYTQTVGTLSNYSVDRLDRWTAATPNASQPRMTYDDPNENMRFSDRYVEDGSYIRLRNIQLGYSFNKSLIEKMRLSKLRIYVSADNLLTFTDYSGWNPEVSLYQSNALMAGVDYATYPMPTIITGGVNITF